MGGREGVGRQERGRTNVSGRDKDSKILVEEHCCHVTGERTRGTKSRSRKSMSDTWSIINVEQQLGKRIRGKIGRFEAVTDEILTSESFAIHNQHEAVPIVSSPLLPAGFHRVLDQQLPARGLQGGLGEAGGDRPGEKVDS
eukprot:768539-Hanusia_phi.AAC.6